MSKPKLSVLMANYNHGRYLPDSLSAILNQSYEPTEIIVVDDGSTDDSVQILERFARSYPNFRFIRNHQNRGVIYSANRALLEATGDCLCFCSADDRVLPGFFQDSMSMLVEYPDAGACTALVNVMGAAGDVQGLFQPFRASAKKCFIPPARAGEILRRRGTWYIGPAVIYRRETFIAAGGLIPELGPMCDDFLFMVIALRFGVCHIPEPLAVWRRMEGTYSSATGADLGAARRIIDHAMYLIRTTYRDLFSTALASRLEGRWLFSLGARGISQSCRSRLSRVEAQLPAGVLGFISGGLLRGAIEVYRWSLMLVLLIRFRPGDIFELIGRRIRALFAGTRSELCDVERKLA